MVSTCLHAGAVFALTVVYTVFLAACGVMVTHLSHGTAGRVSRALQIELKQQKTAQTIPATNHSFNINSTTNQLLLHSQAQQVRTGLNRHSNI